MKYLSLLIIPLIMGCAAKSLDDFTSAEIINHVRENRTARLFPSGNRLTMCVKKEEEAMEEMGCIFFGFKKKAY